MKTLKIYLTIIFTLGFFFATSAQNVSEKSSTVDTEKLAKKLVSQCGNIHEGEIVLISGSVRDLELLENIAVNIRMLGAYPLLTLGSDRMTRRLWTEVPVKYDSQTPILDMKLAEIINAVISVNITEAADLLADIPPERFITVNKTYEPVNSLYQKRKVKGVYLGNGLYPTDDQAKQFGLSRAELSEIFWKGVNTDYDRLETMGKSLKTILMAGKEIHLTNPNGTDLTFRIENRPVFVSDGIISEEDIQDGFAACQVYLPAGEVFVTPVAGSAEGKVIVDRSLYQGKEITGLNLVFQEGKLTSITAKSGLEPLKALYDAAEKGKEEFAYIDLGINQDINVKPDSKMLVWIPAGMVTVGIGNNIWAGGENNCPLGLAFFIPGSTVTVDGKVLVDKGVLRY
jgi:leucyl aminopeptidase (aminopeptidase T)